MKKVYPVPSIAAELEKEWADELAACAGVTTPEFLESPTRHLCHPAKGVQLELMDGSSVQFEYAFALIKPEARDRSLHGTPRSPRVPFARDEGKAVRRARLGRRPGRARFCRGLAKVRTGPEVGKWM